MKKNTIIIALIFLLMIIIAIIIMPKNEKNPEPKKPLKEAGTILFYGAGCPHCAIVDNYIKENKVEESISFQSLEIYNNEDNSRLLNEKANACGLDTKRIGVPFLWDNNVCFIGDRQITDYFSTKLIK